MGPLLIIICTVIWGTAFLFQKTGAEHYGPFTLTCYRNILAGFFLLAVVLVRDRFMRVARNARSEYLGGAASGAEICAALETADAILPKERNYFIETTYSQYVHAHHAEDLDLTRRILEERHPGFVAAFDAVMKSTRGHRFNMMVMKRPLFDDYCAWLFDVLFELERRLDISSYSDYDKRVFGFVAERLLDVYVRAKGVRYAEMPVLHLESQHWPRKITAFLNRKFKTRR